MCPKLGKANTLGVTNWYSINRKRESVGERKREMIMYDGVELLKRLKTTIGICN